MTRTITSRAGKSTARFALALALVGAGVQIAQAGGKSPPPAYDVTLENLSYDIHGIKLSYPKIEIKGANIPKAEIEKMLAAETPPADRLKAMKSFSAGSIEIPATNAAFEDGKVKLTLSCTGDRMEKIADGRIGKYSMTNTGCSGQYLADGVIVASGSVTMKSGVLNDYNFLHIYRLWTDTAGADDKEALAFYASSAFEGVSMTFTSPLIDFKGDYGKMSEPQGAKFKLLSRPLKDAVADIATVIAEIRAEDGRPLPPDGVKIRQIETLQKAGLTVVELLENYRRGASKMENYSFTETLKEPKIGELLTIAAKVAAAESDASGGKATGITFSGGKVTGKIGSVSSTGFSLAPFLAEAKSLLTMPAREIELLTTGVVSFNEKFLSLYTSLYDDLGTITLNDLEVIVGGIPRHKSTDPDSESGTTEAVEIKAALKGFTLRMKNPFYLVRSGLGLENPQSGKSFSMRVAIDNLQLPTWLLTLSGKAEAIRIYTPLRAIGIETLNTSFAMDVDWNSQTGDMTINDYRIADESLGGVGFKVRVGNVTPNFFTDDSTTRAMAAAALVYKDFSVQVEDKGGRDKLLTLAAMEQGTTPDQLKAMLPLSLAMIPEPLASSSSVQSIKKAILAFWENPGKLSIAIKAKSEAGLSLADIAMARQDPKSLDAKIDVTATATK